MYRIKKRKEVLKMKKLISLLLAVSVMAMSTVAFAELNPNRTLVAAGQRNPGSWDSTNLNSNYFRANTNVSQAPLYRPGDSLTFKKGTDVTFAEGDVVTFISSKVDAEDYSDATVMFIDQVEASGPNHEFTYTIREDLAEGVYKLEIKIGDAAKDTFYYVVADPKVEMAYLDEDETVNYVYENGTAQYFAAISYGLAGSHLNQAGVAEFGFSFDAGEAGTAVATMPIANYDAFIAEQETDNSTFLFTVAVKDVDENNIPVATGTIVDEQ